MGALRTMADIITQHRGIDQLERSFLRFTAGNPSVIVHNVNLASPAGRIRFKGGRGSAPTWGRGLRVANLESNPPLKGVPKCASYAKLIGFCESFVVSVVWLCMVLLGLVIYGVETFGLGWFMGLFS